MKKAYEEIKIPELKFFKRGKVRDVFEHDGNLLIVATDRISAFDFVLPSLIPEKGKILTQLSKFWFEYTRSICPNHLISTDMKDLAPELQKYREMLEKRFMLVKRAKVIPYECVVRGYISGSGWKDYQSTGKISGIRLSAGLKESEKLEEPIFTPATKAEKGHDLNVSFEEMKNSLGQELTEKIRELSLTLYLKGSQYALSKGIIIADTKFEFGFFEEEVILIDEIFTPDSSRFWPLDKYSPGRAQPSLDKQYVRDYLLSIAWDRKSPPPPLPHFVIEQTSNRYLEIFRRLTGEDEP